MQYIPSSYRESPRQTAEKMQYPKVVSQLCERIHPGVGGSYNDKANEKATYVGACDDDIILPVACAK